MQLPIAALTLPLIQGKPQVIIPSGTFDAPKGSLKGHGPWVLNDDDGKALVEQANSGTDIVIDYEHQTILSVQNGQPAPASGWLIAGGIIWQPAIGVVATEVRWTNKAGSMIKEGEYRFLSPVFSYAPQGIPKALLSVALTNTPALSSLQELAIAATNKGYFMADSQTETPVENEESPFSASGMIQITPPTDGSSDAQFTASGTIQIMPSMEMSAMDKPPPEDATTPPPDATATPPVPNSKAAPPPIPKKPTQAALSIAPPQMLTALSNQITMLGEDNKRLRAELEKLQQQVVDNSKHGLIAAALSSGKLQPGMEAWAQSMTVEALNSYLTYAKPIAALSSTQTRGIEPKNITGIKHDLNADEIAICKQFNITHERYVAQRANILEEGSH